MNESMHIQKSQNYAQYNGQKFNIENRALYLTNKGIKNFEKILTQNDSILT